MKNIGVLTSGGDSPGMNAVVRSVTRTGIAAGFNVYGIKQGYAGLLARDIIPLKRRDVGGIVQQGGTFLKTARCLDFKDPEVQKKGKAILDEFGIEGLVVVGGDGSMTGARALSNLGIPTVTIPGTIDNDMNGTEYTIGFDTTLNTVIDAVSKIRDTISSHGRVAVIEVMGRHAGHLTLNAGIACGAEVVLLPEEPISLKEMAERLYETHSNGKKYSIVLVAEGAYSAYEVYNYLKDNTYFDPTVTVLGYIQRGGSPSARDNIMAALMGEAAVNAFATGVGTNGLVGYINGKVVVTPYDEVDNFKFPIDDHLYKLLRVLSS